MFVNKHFAYPWRYKREILYLHGISKVSISQEVKGVIKRNLPYIIFYVMTNTLQCFIICINASDFFFLPAFSFTSMHNSHGSRERGRVPL